MATVAANMEAISKFTKTVHSDTYEYISPKKLDLSGRSVFITGASKGVGKETALSFATAGCSKIGIGARSDLSDVVAEIKEAAKKAGRTDEPQVVSVRLDVTSEDSVEAAAKIISNEFDGKLDILINNAGYLPEWLEVSASKTNEWWMTYEVNVKGVYLCSKHFIPLLLKGDLKTNVLTTSAGAIAVIPSASAYQSTKFVVCRLAEFIAAEYQDQGLVCFALHPGGIKTELACNMPEFMHKILVDEPQLPGDSVVWLTAENRPWLNGRFVNSRWDMEELEARKDDIVKQDLLKFRLTTSI
ncbi:NAD(P)-binding protein [Annulohypoxylon maeteangense]|uniref:NAD(P)-binding protein n=1 Tax=Annulohypoxylon maeteangense TaxID=1927788 RepID=UPI002008432F|nr:NAD(P)-binding protein [Annulohypoxylon maeteangense]KAI0883365.1 NAD(P)-binding protein [Annulohypoxylon maeteangense]